MTSSLLFFLLVLACPLLMWLMMRGRHGGHGHAGHGANQHSQTLEPASLDALRRRREELDREIATHQRR